MLRSARNDREIQSPKPCFHNRRMMHDVVIIGGGHNGLVCSAYLAMAGIKVVVLDQRPVV